MKAVDLHNMEIKAKRRTSVHHVINEFNNENNKAKPQETKQTRLPILSEISEADESDDEMNVTSIQKQRIPTK